MPLKTSIKRALNKINILAKDENGASGIEYAIVAAMVAVVIVAFTTPIGDAIQGIFLSICTDLGGVSCPT